MSPCPFAEAQEITEREFEFGSIGKEKGREIDSETDLVHRESSLNMSED